MLPAYAAMASAIVLLAQVFIEAGSLGFFKKSNDDNLQDGRSLSRFTRKGVKLGGKLVLSLRIARVISAILWLVADWFTAKRVWMPGYIPLASTAVRLAGHNSLLVKPLRRLAGLYGVARPA